MLFEVHSESFSKDNEDSFQETLNTQTLIDSTNVGQSSRYTAASTSTFGYNGLRDGTDDGNDNNGGNDRGNFG